MGKLAEKNVLDRLKSHKGWAVEKGQLHRVYAFKGFREAMAFVTRVALCAEPMDHHPDIDIRYSKVALNLSTHSEGGITEKDFQLIQEIDAV